MVKRKRALVMLVLAFLMIFSVFSGTPAVRAASRPSGPYVPLQTIRDALTNVGFYLQNLEDSNVVGYFGTSVISLQSSASVFSDQMACAKSRGTPACISGVGTTFIAPSSPPNGAADWVVNSLTFLVDRSSNFDGRLVAYIYQTSAGLPASLIETSNTLRASRNNMGDVTINSWNFTFSSVGKNNAVLTPGVKYFASLEIRDDLTSPLGGGLVVTNGNNACTCFDFHDGSWNAASATAASVASIGFFAQKHYTVIKEYPAFPTRFDGIHDDASPDTTNHITAQTEIPHEMGMLRNIQCLAGNQAYSNNIVQVSGAPDGGAYDLGFGNILEDQSWGNDGFDNPYPQCPTNLWTEPQINDAAFSPNRDSQGTSCGGFVGFGTIFCGLVWKYTMTNTVTSRTDNVYLGNSLRLSLNPPTSGQYFTSLTQPSYQSFRYSARHAQQLANKFYAYVLELIDPSFATRAQLIQSLLNDNNFGPDIYDPLFNADYNLADNYLSNSTTFGPYHDCYVFNQLPGHSDTVGGIGTDYYPYRSAVCSNMPTTLSTYLCFATGCAPFTKPDTLYLALHARHLFNKYGDAIAGETDINNACWDGKGLCQNQALSGAYSAIRLATYLSALVKLEILRGPGSGYTISGAGCPAGVSCLLDQRVNDVASILWKLQIGAGSWSSNPLACGSTLPGAFEDASTGTTLCSPLNIGGFVVGYVPGDAPFAFKSPRGNIVGLAEGTYCALILSSSGCVNMDSETPFATPTNTETTIVSMMALLDYYKLTYPGDVTLDGKVNIFDLGACALHFGQNTGGLGNKAITGTDYLFMCDQTDIGTTNIVALANIAVAFGADYGNFNAVTNGGFEAGSLTGWGCSPNCSDANVVTTASSGLPIFYGVYMLKMSDAVNAKTTLSQSSLNPASVNIPFLSSGTFYLPNLVDLGTQAAFPQFEISFGSFPTAFFIQPSGFIFSGITYDCFDAVTGTAFLNSCIPNALTRNGWNTWTVRVDSFGQYNTHLFINGADIMDLAVAPGPATGFSIAVEKCSTIISPPQTCGGTTSDYYYVDNIVLSQS
jgi:hypothetical protein